ncbi:MAG: cation:proton antiporter, partial [Rhodothermales bacterium]
SGVTSILTTTRMLARGRLLETRISNIVLGGALVADTLALVSFATIMGVMDAGNLDPQSVAFVAFKALLFFIVTAAIGFKLFPWFGRQLTALGLQHRSFHFTLVVLIAFAFGQMAELAGLHSILGAFVAGLFLRENVLGRALANDLLKAARNASVGFLAPVFFVTAGFAVSLRIFETHPGLLAAIVAAAVVGKILGTVLFYLPTRRGWREGFAIGAAMSSRGEIEIIIAGVGLQMGLISPDVFSILVIMAVATTLMTPWLFKWATSLLRNEGDPADLPDDRTNTIIVGAGPLARAVGRVLGRTGRVRFVDTSKECCAFAESDGLDITCGNALDENVLGEIGAGRTEMLIAMTGNAEVNALAAQIARTVFRIPQVLVVQSENGGDGYETALNVLKASTLFGGPIVQDSWDHWIGQDELIRTKIPVRKLSARTPLKLSAELKRRGEYLPLAVKREGRYLPFHSSLEVHLNDEIVLLAPRRRDATSDPILDRFDRLVARSPVLDLDRTMKFDEFLEIAIASLALQSEVNPAVLAEAFLRRERMSSSILIPGLAVPHVLVEGEDEFHLLIARSRGGVSFPGQDEAVHSIFLIIRSADERAMHLKSLAAIAQTVQGPNFDEKWLTAWGAEEIRRILLVAERRRFVDSEVNGQEMLSRVEFS